MRILTASLLCSHNQIDHVFFVPCENRTNVSNSCYRCRYLHKSTQKLCCHATNWKRKALFAYILHNYSYKLPTPYLRMITSRINESSTMHPFVLLNSIPSVNLVTIENRRPAGCRFKKDPFMWPRLQLISPCRPLFSHRVLCALPHNEDLISEALICYCLSHPEVTKPSR